MRTLLTYGCFLFFVQGFGQRPDMTIGAHIGQQMLFDRALDQRYYAPALAVDMEVAHRRMAGQFSIGLKGADPAQTALNPGQFTKYFINIDLSVGFFLIKHPAFKWRFNLGASNLFNMNRYQSGSPYNIPVYSLQAFPELHVRYKYYMASLFYSVPVLGFDTRGTGLKIGIGF